MKQQDNSPWTPGEDQMLLELVNKYRSQTGSRTAWRLIPNGKMFRSPEAMKNRWNHHLKAQCIEKDRKYILTQTELKMKPKRTKPKRMKKSFLWGLYTVEREA